MHTCMNVVRVLIPGGPFSFSASVMSVDVVGVETLAGSVGVTVVREWTACTCLHKCPLE